MNHVCRPRSLPSIDGESVGRALALVGERWTLLILREAFFGVRRYGQLARNLNIPRPTLSARLRTLVDAGLLERVLYARDPDRHEYRSPTPDATCSRQSLALMRWGDRVPRRSRRPPIILAATRRVGDSRPPSDLPSTAARNHVATSPPNLAPDFATTNPRTN